MSKRSEKISGEIKDLSIEKLKMYYECADKGNINQYFDKDLRDLAKKYGIKFWASGMDFTTGIRDMAFGEK